jgi:Tfp pilus assembly protein PilE
MRNVRLGSTHGGTLVEVLASTVLISILAAMAYDFARAALMSVRVQDAKSEVQEAAVMASDILGRELRLAGFSAVAQPLPAVLDAEAEAVEIASDLNGDGDSADAHEQIAYRYDPAGQQLTRATAGGSPQPFVSDIPPGGMRFVFYDASGAEMVPGVSGLGAADRRRIRAIGWRIRVQVPNPDPRAAALLTATVAGSVCLRNPSG